MNAQTKIDIGTVPAVYASIASVMAHMAKEGISKDRKSGDSGGPKFNFRGIDDVYNALAPVLSSNQLMMLPRMLSREQQERQTRNGGVMFYTTVEAEFDIVSGIDGSRHTVRTFGEAMDSSDKSTNKAMSAAFKYAAMQAFCIPTEGDNDADAVTHEVTPTAVRQQEPLPTGLITDKTRDWVATQIDKNSLQVGALCKAMSVTSLKALTYEQMDDVKNWLRDQRKAPPPRQEASEFAGVTESDCPF